MKGYFTHPISLELEPHRCSCFLFFGGVLILSSGFSQPCQQGSKLHSSWNHCAVSDSLLNSGPISLNLWSFLWERNSPELRTPKRTFKMELHSNENRHPNRFINIFETWNFKLRLYISVFRRHMLCKDYCNRKWTWSKFKTWTMLFVFHIVLRPLVKGMNLIILPPTMDK